MNTPNAVAMNGPGGHPWPLFQLFMVEMWERFSFYGMRALLILYMVKGFLQAEDSRAYSIYAAYGALVYATPYIGGVLADQFLGKRRAVIIGGLLMSAGHLLMGVENEPAFYHALALLIVGNGFFKPNISTMVGELYPQGAKRDSGFTIFYIGINLGAALAPIACGYIGEAYGWHYGFGLATVGMLSGLVLFVLPGVVGALLMMLTALSLSIGMLLLPVESTIQAGLRWLLAIALTAGGGISALSMLKGGLPDFVGRAPEGVINIKGKLIKTFVGTLIAIPIIAQMVQRTEISRYFLFTAGSLAFGYMIREAAKATKIERDRMKVIFVLIFFLMIFWSFFDQGGSSINLFTDRNVDRVQESKVVEANSVGTTIQDLTLTQEQLGYTVSGEVITIEVVDGARELARYQAVNGEGTTPDASDSGPEASTIRKAIKLAPTLMGTLEASGDGALTRATVDWPVEASHVGMGLGESELRTSEFQAANPTFILIFGLLFSVLWAWMGRKGIEPSTPTKFALGIAQLALGFLALWWGAKNHDELGMVAVGWLLLSYMLQTTGELCLSPVGLSMVTRLAPARIVSTVMGAWFLGTALSHDLAGLIAKLTAIEPTDGEASVPVPLETVDIYAGVFGQIGVAALVVSVICFALVPLLKKWQHEGVEDVHALGN